MRHVVTEADKALLLQQEIHYSYRLYVLNSKEGNVLDELNGISSIGSYQIDADSTIRRTTSFVLQLHDSYSSSHIEEKIESWIGYDFVLQIGIYSIRDGHYTWYDCGTYTITSTNTSYDAVTNTLSTELSDWFSKLDGTRNGQIGGAPTILIPNKDENGTPVTIRQAATGILKDNGIQNYIIQDIGEFYGMDSYHPDYAAYRASHPAWNHLPYDLKYSAGCTLSDILLQLRDLYPNCEMCYDVYNNFCFHMIPSCSGEPLYLDNEFLQKILIADNSESVAYDISSIKNVTEVFGKTYDVDAYCETCSFSSNVYTLNLDEYGAYERNQILSFKAPASNLASPQLRVNSLAALPIYYEGTKNAVAAKTMQKDTVYAVKIVSLETAYAAYFLGSFQPHALCVLTNNAKDNFYTKDYFKAKFNCENVAFRTEADNPFAIQRIGILLDVKSGDSFDNIISDSVALQNAVYYNKLSSTTKDTVTITTHMIPWLDVNTKVSYQKQQESKAHEYMIKSISHDLSNYSTSITLHRFYPLQFE